MQRNVKSLMYSSVKVSLELKCLQINKLCQNAKMLHGFLFNLKKVNAIYLNIVLVLQDWLNPYCSDKNSNIFAWMARTIHCRCPVDSATLVVMAKLLDVQLQIFNCEGLWDTDIQGPQSPMMFLVYIGGGKFVKPHVGNFYKSCQFCHE